MFVVSVESPRGVTAFMVEGFLTKELNSSFPYIKRVDLTVDTWSTVMANSKVGTGKCFPDTLCYVSFCYGLKQSLAQGSIVQNPIGRVEPDDPEVMKNMLRHSNVVKKLIRDLLCYYSITETVFRRVHCSANPTYASRNSTGTLCSLNVFHVTTKQPLFLICLQNL